LDLGRVLGRSWTPWDPSEAAFDCIRPGRALRTRLPDLTRPLTGEDVSHAVRAQMISWDNLRCKVTIEIQKFCDARNAAITLEEPGQIL